MVALEVKSQAGKKSGSITLDDNVFAIEPNVGVMHQVVNAQLAARRAGTHKVKTRSEVRGGGAKPWAQKGTGRARAGTSRSPIWVGGGVAHGPSPRSYAEKTNKKEKALALRSALSDRVAEEKMIVVDSWEFDEPSTKKALEVLGNLGVETKALILVHRDDKNAELSFRNLSNVLVLDPSQINPYDILRHDYLIVAKADISQGEES